MWRELGRGLGLVLLVGLSLQLYFVARIAAMAVLDPQSTSFERSEALRVAWHTDKSWQQSWRDRTQISPHMARAVLASEDAQFSTHGGVEWDAIRQAWRRNEVASDRAQALNEKRQAQAQKKALPTPPPTVAPKIVGGSTITQQLAKNLFLSGERNLLRKGQELVITLMLEALLSKSRILEIYLNHVELGEGVFGVQAASQHYFKKDAQRLSASEAARLAVMLPAPKRFELRPQSAYLQRRAATVLARMSSVSPP